MANNSAAINEELKRFQHTKNTFQNCERLLRTAQFSGAECEQVAQCIALISYMVKETDNTMKSLREELKKKDSPQPQPIVAPPVITDDVLGAHIPDAE